MARHRILTLSDEQLGLLQHERLHHEHPRVRQRMDVIYLRANGLTQLRVAEMLGICRDTVAEYENRYEAGGIDALKDFKWGGRPRYLSDSQLDSLCKLLQEGATAHGWPNDLWTARRVRELIGRRFNVGVSLGHTSYILKNYLGWTSQRPTTQLWERDEKKIERWPMVQFRRILKQAEERCAYLAFADEAGFMLMPTLRKTFAPRGQRPVVKTANPHGRISTACAITISPRNQRANLYFQMLPDNANYTGRLTARFLDFLFHKLNAPFFMVWDSIPIHLAAPVRALTRARGNVSLRMFPKYAPELNPADKVWCYIKYSRLANYAPFTLAELRETVTKELLALKERTDLLHAFIRHAGLDIKYYR